MRYALSLCLAFITAGSAVHLRGQALPSDGNLISPAAAQSLVNAGYPDLIKQRLAFQFGMKGDHVFIHATPPVDLLHPQSEQSAVLAIDVVFSGDQRIAKFLAGGTATEQDKNDALRAQINNHPELSPGDLADLVTDGSGTYGPANAPDLSSHLDTSRWTSFLGTQLTVISSQFQWRRDGASDAEAKPGWVVSASAQATDGSLHHYVLRFEPFAGQLVELNEVQ